MKAENVDNEHLTFLSTLVNMCHDEFSSMITMKIFNQGDEKIRYLRKRAIGNIRLIINLYKKNLISDKILDYIISDICKAILIRLCQEGSPKETCRIFIVIPK